MIIDYPWYFLLLCLLAGALYAWWLYRRTEFSKPIRWLLTVLRSLVVSVIAFLLLSPVLRQKVHERQRPRIVLAQDVSGSVSSTADSSFSLMPLYDDLKDKYDVEYLTFGSDASTDIAAAITGIPAGREVSALVLASDGISNRGTNPTSVAEHLSYPIYTVALGDTTPRCDASLGELRYNRIAFRGSDFPIEMTVNATKLAGRIAVLTVSTDGHQLFSQKISYDADQFSQSFGTSLPATEAGLKRYTVSLTVLDGEAVAENNRQTFYVDVIDNRRKVAIVANAPHPDLSVLKRSIESSANYEAKLFLASDPVKLNDEYSLVILHNLPSATHTSLPFELDKIPQIYIVGMQTDLPRFNALHTGLEIVSKATGKSNEVTALHQEQFSLFLYDNDDAAIVEQLPPLKAPFGESRLSAGVQTLFNARLGNIDMRQPLIAATVQGPVRKAFVWGEGLWRWRLSEYQMQSSYRAFDRLISQLVGFTTMSPSRDRLQVSSERCYNSGERIVLGAQLYNEAFELFNTPDVTFILDGDSIRKAEYAFARTGNAYSLRLPDLPEGIYRYTASTKYDGETITTSGTFAVETLNLEQRNLTADHTLLRTMSTLSGGELYYSDQLSNLQSSLSSLKPTIYTHIRYADLLHLPWVLALILLLLAAEWVLRRYHGEI